MALITEDQLVAVVPKTQRKSVNAEIIQKINQLSTDPDLREMYRDNIIGWSSVLKEGKFKLENYIDAVRYVSFKMMGDTNTDAWVKTFPDRYQRLLGQNMTKEDMRGYVSMYSQTKLVSLIRELAMIPTWLVNAEVYQKAINVQADLMMTAKSEKIRSEAANSILTHLKRPEVNKAEFKIQVEDSTEMDDLKQVTAQLAKQQQEIIANGLGTAGEIAEAKIIQGEVIDE